VEGVDEVELLYSFVHASWGQSLATEIAEALAGLAFGRYGLKEIAAYSVACHHASRRVMEKAGFVYECARQFKGADCVFYRLRMT
jgi:RimJ/RimL family protein N-acetyltransferase